MRICALSGKIRGAKLIQVYTGDGKGKTTAAFGLALRATGAGLRVYICQFLKGKYCSELMAFKKIKNIKVEQFGAGCFVRKAPAKKDMDSAERGIKAAKKAVCGRLYDIVILDEINVALKLGLVKLDDVIFLIKNTSKKTELVLTGRGAHPKIVELADLVSQIKDIKHYYNKGAKGRRGIEY